MNNQNSLNSRHEDNPKQPASPARLAFLASLILGLLTSSALPGENTPLSLADALRKGLENNFKIQISRRQLDIASNNNSWGAAGAYPSINLGLNFNNSRKNEPDRAQPGQQLHYNSHTLSPYVALRWTLFNGFAVSIQKDRLEQLHRLSVGLSAIAVENTIQAVVLTYHKSLLEDEKTKVIDELLRLSTDRLQYVENRKEIGASGTYDVLQARIAQLSDAAAQLQQRMNARNARRNLNLVMGEPAEQNYQLTEAFSAESRDYDLNALLAKLTGNNKTLQNQYINQEILKKDIGLARSAGFPVVSLNSGVTRAGVRLGYENLPAVDSFSYDYYLNFSINLNLFNGGAVRRAVANARIQQQIGAIQQKEMELTLANQLRGQFDLYNVRKQLLVLADERLAAARLNLEISNDKYKAGAINSFNYRDVQNTFLNAAFGRLQAVYDLVETHAELMRLTGGVISEY